MTEHIAGDGARVALITGGASGIGAGVSDTLIAPGMVDTPLWDDFGGSEALHQVPHITAEHVAASIAWAVDQPPGVSVNTVAVDPTADPT